MCQSKWHVSIGVKETVQITSKKIKNKARVTVVDKLVEQVDASAVVVCVFFQYHIQNMQFDLCGQLILLRIANNFHRYPIARAHIQGRKDFAKRAFAYSLFKPVTAVQNQADFKVQVPLLVAGVRRLLIRGAVRDLVSPIRGRLNGGQALVSMASIIYTRGSIRGGTAISSSWGEFSGRVWTVRTSVESLSGSFLEVVF